MYLRQANSTRHNLQRLMKKKYDYNQHGCHQAMTKSAENSAPFKFSADFAYIEGKTQKKLVGSGGHALPENLF